MRVRSVRVQAEAGQIERPPAAIHICERVREFARFHGGKAYGVAIEKVDAIVVRIARMLIGDGKAVCRVRRTVMRCCRVVVRMGGFNRGRAGAVHAQRQRPDDKGQRNYRPKDCPPDSLSTHLNDLA